MPTTISLEGAGGKTALFSDDWKRILEKERFMEEILAIAGTD